MTKSATRSVDLAAVVVSAALVALVALGTGGPLRLALALVFTTAIPGWAILPIGTRLTPPDEPMAAVALAVGLSLAVCTVSATILVWLRWFRPDVLFFILATLVVLRCGARLASTTHAAGPRREGEAS